MTERAWWIALVRLSDSFGATIRNMRDRIEARVTSANAERLVTQPANLPPG